MSRCQWCGREYRPGTGAKRGSGRGRFYCSVKCRGEAQRRVPVYISPEEMLASMQAALANLREVVAQREARS